jgi:putative aminopeptidase FrvX
MDSVLQRLIACHSTPGDEGEVRDVLEACWRAEGWQPRRLGDYAVTARASGAGASGRPVLLVCAHMDSPGYSVDRLAPAPAAGSVGVSFGVTGLGGPEFGGRAVQGLIKTRQGRFPGVLRVAGLRDEEPDLRFELDAEAAAEADVRHGDRVCFAPQFTREGPLLRSPFLDNRLGCWALARLAAEARAWPARCELVLGATASEELCGFGARVLAAQVRPDAVLVLDTTYESDEQGVRLGQGPVLTLSDASVLLSPATRDRVLDILGRAGVPVQTEVYNFSGTDARAFPRQGLACPVLPLLVPTRGNHAPCETADERDLEAWLPAIRAIAENFF